VTARNLEKLFFAISFVPPFSSFVRICRVRPNYAAPSERSAMDATRKTPTQPEVCDPAATNLARNLKFWRTFGEPQRCCPK
jgi:hypothetical protein